MWEGVKIFYISMKTRGKGHEIDASLHQSGITHARDPMRCPVAMLGLYFIFRLFVLNERCPRLGDFVESLHKVPLIRQSSGKKASVTDYNDKLKDYLNLIEAGEFTMHGWRNQRIKEAGEDPESVRDNIKQGAGHGVKKGSHENNYSG